MRLRKFRSTRTGRWLVRHGPDWFAPRDPLSGAYHYLALGRVRPGSSLAFADIVDMRRVNHPDGRSRGDQVIAEIGGRLRSGLPGARVYRVGGDEFLVQVRRLGDEAEALALGSRIAALADEPFDGVSSPVRLRVAVAVAPAGRDSGGAMRRLEDALWHQARNGGVVLADSGDADAEAGG